MDLMEAILTRRSIRKFTGDVVRPEDLTAILRAGSYAPSAMNRQPWHFVTIQKPETLEAVTRFQPYTRMLPSAGCGIVVCGDKLRQPQTGFLVEDCSAAIQNMLLAAHALGLGAVWCGLYPVSAFTKPMSKLLKLPIHMVPVGLIAVGHKVEDRTTAERFDPARVHAEAW